MAASLTRSSIRRFRNFSVETEMLSKGAINSLLESLGNISFTVCSASVQAILSSLVSALKCSLFVPVKIENLLSSDLLSRIDETYKKLLRFFGTDDDLIRPVDLVVRQNSVLQYKPPRPPSLAVVHPLVQNSRNAITDYLVDLHLLLSLVLLAIHSAEPDDAGGGIGGGDMANSEESRWLLLTVETQQKGCIAVYNNKPTDIDEDEARRQQTGAGDQNWQKKFPAMYGDVAEEKEKTSTRRKDPDI
nr:Os12g0285650 [Ipomoea batatas]